MSSSSELIGMFEDNFVVMDNVFSRADTRIDMNLAEALDRSYPDGNVLQLHDYSMCHPPTCDRNQFDPTVQHSAQSNDVHHLPPFELLEMIRNNRCTKNRYVEESHVTYQGVQWWIKEKSMARERHDSPLANLHPKENPNQSCAGKRFLCMQYKSK